MNDDNDPYFDEDGLTMVYCSRCGGKLGRVGEGSRTGLLCSQCKTEYLITFNEETVLQTRSKRKKKSV